MPIDRHLYPLSHLAGQLLAVSLKKRFIGFTLCLRFICMQVCASYVFGASGGHKGLSDPLGLELWTILGLYVGILETSLAAVGSTRAACH